MMNVPVGETHNAMMLLAGIGALGVASGPEAVRYLNKEGFTPVTVKNVVKILKPLLSLGYVCTANPTGKSIRTAFSMTDKGRERLRRERSELLKIADIIDIVVPP